MGNEAEGVEMSRGRPKGIVIDLTGQRFGRLTARELIGVRNGNAEWLCDCQCGGERIVRACDLKSRMIQRCANCGISHRSEAQNKMLARLCLTLDDRELAAIRGLIKSRKYEPGLEDWREAAEVVLAERA